MKRKRKVQSAISGEQKPNVQFTPASVADEDPVADQMQANQGRKDELEPLSHEEMSQTYGIGFSILRRMGYSGAGFKPGSLHAPLAARANAGRQGLMQAAEAEESQKLEDPPEQPAVDLTKLLSQTLRSMREAGDDDEACELEHLATFCNLQGGALEALEPSRPKRKRKTEKIPLIKPGDAADEQALTCLLKCFEDQNFPVELQEQSEHLRWQACWGATHGCLEDFVARQEGQLRIVMCPGGARILLPRQPQSESTEKLLRQKCMDFCVKQRAQFAGKCQARRKWQHLIKTLATLFRGRSQSNSRPPRDRDKVECAASALPEVSATSFKKVSNILASASLDEDTDAP